MTRREMASVIDHTLLKADATRAQIEKLCREAVDCGFHSVCVNLGRAEIARQALEGSEVALCVVIGFPLGASGTKPLEAARAVELGVDEIDMVMDIGSAKDGSWDAVEDEIRAVREACPGKVLKVILETCLLTGEEIDRACSAAAAAGADFVKTSTGFSTGGAKSEDVRRMKRNGLKVKASGGIRTAADAEEMLRAGADRIGASAGVEILKSYSE